MEKFDLIVIGGGPAGYHGAERAAHHGLKTLLIEKGKLGGVCLNEGCIPSKALLNSAKVLSHAKHGGDYGVYAEAVRFDQAKVVERKNTVVRRLVAGIKAQLKTSGVTVVEGLALVAGKTPEGFLVRVNAIDYVGARLLIATGSTPAVPPIDGLKAAMEQGAVMTNREILDLTSVPARLTIVGGGVIGVEMAAYFAAVGSHVEVIEMLDKIAGPTESEITGLLQKALEKLGVVFHLKSTVTAIGTSSVTFRQDGKDITLDHDKVLLSIGRRPVTNGLGLESIGVEMAKNGAVVTDDKLRTSVANVYAAGDVNGKWMLAHAAYREAEVAVNQMLGHPDRIQYESIASVIYTTPEVASVGLTDAEAAAKGLDVSTVSIPLAFSGRAMAENIDVDGLFKLVINNKTNTLVGAHLIGSYASEIIVLLASLIQLEIDIRNITKLVFPHPTVGEIIKDALFKR